MARANGEVIKEKVFLISKDPGTTAKNVDVPLNVAEKCCFCLPVFGDTSDTDPLKNDINGFIEGLEGVSGIIFILQKNETGTFTDIATLTGSAYGTDFPFGFLSLGNRDYAGYRIDWRNVIGLHGVGTYRVKTEITPLFGAVAELLSFTYELRNYSALEADNTVRLEFYLNNLIGDWRNPAIIRDFGSLNWKDMIRFPRAIFGREVATYSTEEVRFSNGVLIDFKDDQTPEYELEIEGLPFDVHRFVKTQVLMSGEILATDYNSTNPSGDFVDFGVKKTGDYAPGYAGELQTPGVKIAFVRRINNLRKKSC